MSIWTQLAAVAALIFAAVMQFRVGRTYDKYLQDIAKAGLTGAETARKMLHDANIFTVRITTLPGRLTDHYDPTTQTIRLSPDVHSGKSISAVSIAAHEAAHAIQHSEDYAPFKSRLSYARFAGIGSKLSIPMILLGAVLSGIDPETNVTGVNIPFMNMEFGVFLVNAGLILLTSVVVFSLITLPVEFNASSRAKVYLEDTKILSGDEVKSAVSVLNAAAWTYVASAVSSIISLVRWFSISRRR